MIPTQGTAKDFEQEQDLQGQQNLNQPTNAENQTQTVSTGGENFGVNLSAANNTTQTQAAQVQAPEVLAQAPQDDFNVPGQIVEQARLIRTAQNTEMVIHLKPEHLGDLTLRISVSQNGAVNASFHSDNAQVRMIIENSLVQLKQELNNQGLKVENVDVYAGLSDGGLMNGQGQQAWQQNQQQQSRRGGRIDFASFDEDVDALTPVNQAETADGVDYMV